MDGDDDADERVRVRLAQLGADADSAPYPPAEVTARIGAALRAAPPPTRTEPAHAARTPLRRRRLAGIAGITAAVVGVGLGAFALTQRSVSLPSTEVSARHITVTRSAPVPPAPIPLTNAELRALLTMPSDFGPLSDVEQRAGCLQSLGSADGTVLGARPVDLDGTAAVLLLLPGATPGTLAAVAVAPRCDAGDAAVLTEWRNLHR